ncbi:MAG: hypothetical protein DRP50_03915 [Thermotoga sp.]|nr:MAG: hypothetical protein DRP50_03915 [Thermotoga sp.]
MKYMRYIALGISIWLIAAGFLSLSPLLQSVDGFACGGILLVMAIFWMNKEEVNWQSITVSVISIMLLISAFLPFYSSHPRWYNFTWGWILIANLMLCRSNTNKK